MDYLVLYQYEILHTGLSKLRGSDTPFGVHVAASSTGGTPPSTHLVSVCGQPVDNSDGLPRQQASISIVLGGVDSRVEINTGFRYFASRVTTPFRQSLFGLSLMRKGLAIPLAKVSGVFTTLEHRVPRTEKVFFCGGLSPEPKLAGVSRKYKLDPPTDANKILAAKITRASVFRAAIMGSLEAVMSAPTCAARSKRLSGRPYMVTPCVFARCRCVGSARFLLLGAYNYAGILMLVAIYLMWKMKDVRKQVCTCPLFRFFFSFFQCNVERRYDARVMMACSRYA